MDIQSKMILDEYDENIDVFNIINDVTLRKIRAAIAKAGLVIESMTSRIKTKESLLGKLERKGYKYKTITDITDLVGARIVTFYDDEVDKVAAIIENLFIVDRENSIDKRRCREIDRYGYMSLHYICQIPKEMYYNEKYPLVNEFKFEIQMRTVLQHAWASIEHDLGYKATVEIPREYLRRINRLAGLLEIADFEFESVRNDITQYRRNIEEIVKDGDFGALELNGDTFTTYMKNDPFRSLTKKIASVNKAEIYEASYTNYLKVFKMLEFEKLSDIEGMRNKYSADAYKLAIHQLGSTDLDIITSTTGLQNLCMVYILKKGDNENGIIKFLETLNGKRKSSESYAKKIVKIAKEIGIIE